MRKGKIYAILRRYTKLPRPTEIWGDKVEDRWTLRLTYFYWKLIFGEAIGHLTLPKSIVDTIVQFLILFEVKKLGSDGLLIGAGVILLMGLSIVGHILQAMGFIRQQSQLQTSQSPDIIEIRDNLRELKNKLK